ncbi:MAG: signal peptide peptidase SppA, partial [Planctomycetota bacterium]|nr:signal peptide peptidase SppA [Planctomycetota bacterium]
MTHSVVTPTKIVPKWRRRFWLAASLLAASVVVNLVFWSKYDDYYAGSEPPAEHFYDGDRGAKAKIARIEVVGTISPPFTGRILSALERAEDDEDVAGVLLIVDSPGGLVADSHQIYHRLERLRAKKPIVVSMKRLAASGGLYVAMGAGPEGLLFAEPTTWTGSIGVIVPRFDVSGLADKIGVHSDSLKTGELKDSLNPFRPLSEKDEVVWKAILADSFDRFIGVIDSNRNKLDDAGVRELATGQIYTAQQALDAGLIDEIGFEEDALAALR